jgi:hypothetical protein
MDINDFHPQTISESGAELIKKFETLYSNLAAEIMASTARSAHQTAALRLLLESKMTLVHSITHP